jgi:acetyl esterase/lipase
VQLVHVIAAVVAVYAVLPGCSGTDLLNGLAPRDGWRVVHDLAYGVAPRHRLDLYVPEAAAGPVPIVVFFYGGSWQRGDRGDFLFVAEALASRGYLVVVPDYRVYPEVLFPGFVEDGAAAVAWVRDNAAAVAGVEPGPLFLMGHSAGAHIAAMLALDGRWLAAAGADRADVAAVVGLAGPYDFLPLRSSRLKTIFGPEERWPETQPINHVDGRAPPMLLVTGRDDFTVRPANSQRLATRVREAGGEVEVISYDNIGHISLIAAFARPLRGLAPVVDDVDRYLRRIDSTAGH